MYPVNNSNLLAATSPLSWKMGLNAFEAGDLAEASNHWHTAVKNDCGNADAWLGLHAIDPGVDDYLLQVIEHGGRLGEMNKMFNCQLNSSYWPGGHTPAQLADIGDAYRALALIEVDATMQYQALDLAGRHPLTDLVQARLLFEAGSFGACIAILDPLQLPEMQGNIDLLAGASRVALGETEAGVDQLLNAMGGNIDEAGKDIARSFLIDAHGEVAAEEDLSVEFTEELPCTESDPAWEEIVSAYGLPSAER